MPQTIVRIIEIELKGFKNIQTGRIEMPSAAGRNFFSNTADILGIYGQNGSGKTAVIEALSFMQSLLMGQSLPDDAVYYISKEAEFCTITVKFSVVTPTKKAIATYSVQLDRVDQDDCKLSREILRAALWNGEKPESPRTLIDYTPSAEGAVFLPKYRYEALIRSGDDSKVNLVVAKRMAQKDGLSFLFGAEGREAFLNVPEAVSADYAYIIEALHRYASVNLFVISNAHAAAISLNLMLPFAFRLERETGITKGSLPIALDGPSVISKDAFQIAAEIIDQMNVILNTIIPGFSISLHHYGEQLLANGSMGHKIELTSKRGEIKIPLIYESEGIIKIISVLNALMCVYNNPSMCLVLDELDAGIYEYLLGELLSVFEQGAKGQLIFTSHNLRALEMLNKNNIIFSTTNGENRYIRLQNFKNNSNLRDLYLRSITLGGQKESVYAETDSVEIGRAFRRAGKAVRDGC